MFGNIKFRLDINQQNTKGVTEGQTWRWPPRSLLYLLNLLLNLVPPGIPFHPLDGPTKVVAKVNFTTAHRITWIQILLTLPTLAIQTFGCFPHWRWNYSVVQCSPLHTLWNIMIVPVEALKTKIHFLWDPKGYHTKALSPCRSIPGPSPPMFIKPLLHNRSNVMSECVRKVWQFVSEKELFLRSVDQCSYFWHLQNQLIC